jgi:hypothetical protein
MAHCPQEKKKRLKLGGNPIELIQRWNKYLQFIMGVLAHAKNGDK